MGLPLLHDTSKLPPPTTMDVLGESGGGMRERRKMVNEGE